MIAAHMIAMRMETATSHEHFPMKMVLKISFSFFGHEPYLELMDVVCMRQVELEAA
jgi:hypothetical protein